MSASDGPRAPAVSAAASDVVVDLAGDPVSAGIRIGFDGNQFMVLPAPLELWHERIPASPSVFYETLPPGTPVDQVTVGAIRVGTSTIPAPLDVIAVGPDMLGGLAAGGLVDAPRDHATSDLAHPATEGFGRRTGGGELVELVMVAEYAAGETVLTSVHHRQSAEWVRRGPVDVAPSWSTDALHHTARCPCLRQVPVEESAKVTGRYAIAAVDSGSAWRMWWARSFVTFMGTAEVADLYAAAGFVPTHIPSPVGAP